MIQIVLHKMCEIAGIDFDTVNWQDSSHHKLEWTKEQESEFIKWFANELNTSKLLRESICKYPSLVKGKYRSQKFSSGFTMNYGFRLSN